MDHPIKIAIAHDDLGTLVSLHSALSELGYDVCVDATTGQQLIEKVSEQRPDLLIVKEELPDMIGLQATKYASNNTPIPTILLVDGSDDELTDCPESVNVLAVLAEPVRQADLVPAVPLVTQRFRQLEDLREEINGLREVLNSGYWPVNPTENDACQFDQ